MFALVNSLDIEDISEGGNIMDLKELAKALRLPETATEEEIRKAVEDAAKAAEKLKEMDGKNFAHSDCAAVIFPAFSAIPTASSASLSCILCLSAKPLPPGSGSQDAYSVIATTATGQTGSRRSA